MKRLGLVVLVFVASVVWAQGVPVPSVVQVQTPDGGLSVNLGSSTVNTQVTTPDGGLPVTLGAQRVAVEATGPGGGDVAVAGTVGFDTAATALLSAETCTEYPRDWQSVGSAAASPIPPDFPDGGSGGLEGRTSILIVNTDSTTRVACGVMSTDGGLPQWGVRGDPLSPNNGWAEYPVKANVRVYCRAQTGVSTFMSPKEKICSK